MSSLDPDICAIKVTKCWTEKFYSPEKSNLGGGFFKDFGGEFPSRAIPTIETNSYTITTKLATDTLSTASSSEEPVTTQEPGAHPVIFVQGYRDDPIEEIAVHYVRINRIIENEAVQNRQQEENVRSA